MIVTPAVIACILVLVTLSEGTAPSAWAQDGADGEHENLLVNPGFEEGELGWERRTPNSEDRTLTITREAARTGEMGARIVNLNTTHSRWRQGHDREINIAPGSLIRLSGWIRTELGPEGYAALRIYAMTDDGDITAQPTSRPIVEQSDWTRTSVSLKVPEGTDYVMAYLELPNAAGTADYDDIELVVLSPPRVRQVSVDMLLVTDAPEDHETVRSLHTLYPGRMDTVSTAEGIDPEKYRSAIALERGDEHAVDMDAVEAFAATGGRVVVDLALYARARDLVLREEAVDPDDALLRIAVEHPVTRGFRTGDTIPWHGGERGAAMTRSVAGEVPGIVMGEAADGGALLIFEEIGEGSLLATDLTGLLEPAWNQPGSFNKYLFAGNMLGESVRYGRHFERKLTYAEFMDKMRELADRHDAMQMRDEGPAEDDNRMYSLTIGDEEKPAFFVYAAAHGSEWEPAYGLLALAERLMERPEEALFDFDRYHLVMMPIVNPWGYDNRRRQNINGVDLNRNADERWEYYEGRENEDGVYGPFSYDWKGESPFSELETQAWKRVLDRTRARAVLDFHGNQGGYNRLIIIQPTALPENEDLAHEAVRRFNQTFADRYVLLQSGAPELDQYDINSIRWGSLRPTLTTTAARSGLGFLKEAPAGYRGTHGIVFQTDLTIEICLAFFRAYE